MLALTAQESAIVQGDLSKLSNEERTAYYNAVCESLGLNPLTKPFQYLNLSGKLTLYATRDCADQLRKSNRVSITITKREQIGDLLFVTAQATLPDGRCDESTGAVSIAGLRGENLANAYLKVETKAKRRVTLSICGLGWLDETEVQDIPRAKVEYVDVETGEILKKPPTDLVKQLEASNDAVAKAREFTAAINAAKTIDELNDIGAQISPVKAKLLPVDVKRLGSLYNAKRESLTVPNEAALCGPHPVLTGRERAPLLTRCQSFVPHLDRRPDRVLLSTNTSNHGANAVTLRLSQLSLLNTVTSVSVSNDSRSKTCLLMAKRFQSLS